MVISISTLLGYGIPSLIIFLIYRIFIFNDNYAEDGDNFFMSLFFTVITMGIIEGFWIGAFKITW